MLVFGWNFSWCLVEILKIKCDVICVWTCDMTSRSYFGKMNSTLGSVVPLAMFLSLSEPLRWLFPQRRSDWLWRSFHIQTPCCGEETSPPDPTENRVILGDKSFLNNFQSRSFLTRNKRTKFSLYHDFLIFLLFSLTYRHQHTFSLVKQNPCLVQLNGKMAVSVFIWFLKKINLFLSIPALVFHFLVQPPQHVPHLIPVKWKDGQVNNRTSDK